MKIRTEESLGRRIAHALTVLVAAGLLSADALGGELAKPGPDGPVMSAPATNIPPSVGPRAAGYAGPTDMAPSLRLTTGKSALIRLPGDAARLSVGNPDVADVTLIDPREIYLLGKKIGTTNLLVWIKGGHATIMDVTVGVDTDTLK